MSGQTLSKHYVLLRKNAKTKRNNSIKKEDLKKEYIKSQISLAGVCTIISDYINEGLLHTRCVVPVIC